MRLGPITVILLTGLLIWACTVPQTSAEMNGNSLTTSKASKVTEYIPALVVTKIISQTEINLNTRVLIQVFLKNVGECDAVDITIEDLEIPNTTFSVIGTTEYSFNRIAVNETRAVAYSLQPLREGYFSLGSSNVTFYSDEGYQYFAQSNSIELFVVEAEDVKKGEDYGWYNVLSVTCLVWIVLLILRGFLVLTSPRK